MTLLATIRARLAQGMRTSPFPRGVVEFPERFRGRPALDIGADHGDAQRKAPVSELVTLRPARDPGHAGHAMPMLDAGACLFSPEETDATSLGAVTFTRDYRMASRTRDGLRSPDGEIALADALEGHTRKLFRRSLRLRVVVCGSCGGCEAELNALGNVVFDLARFGVQFVASPRHADGLVITGAVSRNMLGALERTYAAVPDPRIVIAVGACAVSGGPFRGSPDVLDGVPAHIPVDLWIAGCPPHPLTVLDGLLRLLGRIETGERSASG